MFHSKIIAALCLVLLGFGIVGALAREPAVDPLLFKAMEWREVGPYRGGRVTTAVGIPDQPFVYYMGATGGGVWKTENAGITWTNLSDKDFNVGSIGAVAVAPSDPNVVYVGTGESPIRGVTTSHGDGVYKSTDAGKTWSHMGLTETRQIARILVDPNDPDRVYVAAQGNIWGPNPERGIYRSTDGGATWQLVLSANDDTGAADISMDAANPRIIYATLWNHRRNPWFIRSGGDGGGIYKTLDGGDSWERLEGGLPDFVGKIGVAVSGADSNRVYAIVEAEEGGLYRSDDAGETWTRTNSTRIIQARAWYYNHITADPTDADTVYVLNAPFMKSIDGGKTFERRDTPHGDHHDHWINPLDSRIQINANDGGATVTFDGGETWSPQDNQPTAQIYRVSTDNLFPYYLYGGQQDNTTVAIASETFDSGIGREDYFAVGGGESAHIAFDPDNPRLIYATTINATLTEFDRDTKILRPIKPYPEYVFGRHSRDQKYRTNWNAPVAASPHDPSIIYYGTQILLESRDRGVTWKEISPDLTKNDPEKQGLNGGPITNEQAGAEFYNTIFYIVESPHEAGTIWVGSDDGLVHLTRDGGQNWADVTPKGVGEALINAIEVSPHDPATAFIAVAGYKMNDFAPHIYVTRNYGRSWRSLDKGLPEDTFVRVVRQDPEKADILYAGTEAGPFISFNAGRDWQSLKLNLPPVPITDLKIRQGDLVAATQGRGFWIIDDLSSLRQINGDLADRALHLFAPAPAPLIGQGGGFGGGANEGSNPPRGAVLRYYIKDEPGDEPEPLTIEILDAAGQVVRGYSSVESEHDKCMLRNADPRSPLTLKRPAREQGMNQWQWNFRRDDLMCVEDVRVFAGWRGGRVSPGDFTVRVTLGGDSQSQPLRVLPDPRLDGPGNASEYDALLASVTGIMNGLYSRLDALREVRGQIRKVVELTEGHANADAIAAAAEEIIARIGAWEDAVVQTRHETFEDDMNWPNMFDVQMLHLLRAVDAAGLPVTEGARLRYSDLKAEWDRHVAEYEAITGPALDGFDGALRDAGLGRILVPS